MAFCHLAGLKTAGDPEKLAMTGFVGGAKR
jgi:hypothetical protein